MQAEQTATGIAQKTISLSALRAFTIPVPPLDEQNRVAVRVGELMSVFDRLEAAQAERERRRIDARHARMAHIRGS